MFRLPKNIRNRKEEEAARWVEVEVRVPAGAAPGATLPVAHPNKPNAAFTVVIPDGKRPGDRFAVKFPR